MRHLLMASVLLCALWVGSAVAVPPAPTTETWVQCFTLTDIPTKKETDSTFDELEITMTGGKELGPAGLFSQNPAGSLVLSKNGPGHVLGTGTDVGTLEFKLQFVGPLPDPADHHKATQFDFAVYDRNGTTFTKSGHGEAFYRDGAWTINTADGSVSLTPCGDPVVPLPGAVVLGLLGLSAARLKLRRFA